MWVAPGQVIFSRRALINWNKCCPLIKIRHNVTNAVMPCALGSRLPESTLHEWVDAEWDEPYPHISSRIWLGLVCPFTFNKDVKGQGIRTLVKHLARVFFYFEEDGRRAKRDRAEPSEEVGEKKKTAPQFLLKQHPSSEQRESQGASAVAVSFPEKPPGSVYVPGKRRQKAPRNKKSGFFGSYTTGSGQ